MMRGESESEWIDFIPKQIVLILSDSTLERMLEFGLVKKGYSVTLVQPDQAPRQKNPNIDLLISDILNLPVEQATSQSFPIVILRDPVNSGAIETNAPESVTYLDKPFEFENLLTIMDSLMSRNLNFVHALRVSRKQRAFQVHNIRLDPIGMEIQCENHLVKMTWREFHVFLALLQEVGKTVSAKELVDMLAERISNKRTSLTQCINKLRHKLRCCSEHVQIVTEVNEGYRLQIRL